MTTRAVLVPDVATEEMIGETEEMIGEIAGAIRDADAEFVNGDLTYNQMLSAMARAAVTVYAAAVPDAYRQLREAEVIVLDMVTKEQKYPRCEYDNAEDGRPCTRCGNYEGQRCFLKWRKALAALLEAQKAIEP